MIMMLTQLSLSVTVLTPLSLYMCGDEGAAAPPSRVENAPSTRARRLHECFTIANKDHAVCKLHCQKVLKV